MSSPMKDTALLDRPITWPSTLSRKNSWRNIWGEDSSLPRQTKAGCWRASSSSTSIRTHSLVESSGNAPSNRTLLDLRIMRHGRDLSRYESFLLYLILQPLTSSLVLVHSVLDSTGSDPFIITISLQCGVWGCYNNNHEKPPD